MLAVPVCAEPGSPGVLVSPYELKVQLAVESHGTPQRDKARRKIRYLGGITPHHDVALSMIVRFYERLSSGDVKRVWLFAPDHFRQARNLSALCSADWKTSARLLEADRDACRSLGELSIMETNDAMFAREHGITLHIPLAARYFPNAKIVPIVISSGAPDMALLILRNKMTKLMREGDMIILSMDLSHYKTPEEMAAEDVRTLEVLRGLKYNATSGIDVDARRAASLVLRIFHGLGAERGVVMERSDTSEMTGRIIESGTSYATVVYSAE